MYTKGEQNFVRGQATYSLDEQCKTDELLYQALVKRMDTQTVKTYKGLTGGTFKNHYKHISDFRTEVGESATINNICIA